MIYYQKEEIFYGKNGNSDALYTLGLVFDSNDIFPNVSDLSGELNNTDKIDYTGVVSQLMTVYRKNCYEHIFRKPTFMDGNTDVMGSGIKSKATCCIGTGTCSSKVCETTGYTGPILYNTCNNYFEYDKEATSYCTGFTGGVMTYICIYELIPTGIKLDCEKNYTTISFIIGMGFIMISLILLS